MMMDGVSAYPGKVTCVDAALNFQAAFSAAPPTAGKQLKVCNKANATLCSEMFAALQFMNIHTLMVLRSMDKAFVWDSAVEQPSMCRKQHRNDLRRAGGSKQDLLHECARVWR